MNRLERQSIKTTAEMLAKEVNVWGDITDPDEQKETITNINNVILYCFDNGSEKHLDGFLLAYYLKKHYEYRPDTELVNILDKAKEMYNKTYEHTLVSDLFEVKNRLGQAAVDTLSSQFQKGDKVKFVHEKLKKEVSGIIFNIFSFGKVQIYCPELGHCNPFDETDAGNGEGVFGAIVNIDQIKKVD